MSRLRDALGDRLAADGGRTRPAGDGGTNRPARLAAAAGVLLALLVATQLAFTGVGVVHSPAWSDPVEVASVPAAPDGDLVAASVAGGPEGGVVAWITRRNDTWRVRAARFEARDGRVTVGDPWTAATSSTRLADVDVDVAVGGGGSDAAGDGNRIALVWERASANEIVLHERDTGETRVVSAGALRVGEPSVALTPDGAAVAWQFYDGDRDGVRLAAVPADGPPTHVFVGGPTGGEGAPDVRAEGRDVAVVWLDAGRSVVRVTSLRLGDPPTVERTVTLGPARPGGGFGGRTAIAVSGARDGDVVRAAWTHGGSIDAGSVALGEADGVGRVRTLGAGSRPTVAAAGGRWLAAWLYEARGSGWDVAVRLSDDGSVRTLSRLSTNANLPRAAFAPAPTVVWVELGDRARLLASTYRGARNAGVVERLATDPGRFLFVALSAGVVGLVLTPLMPWSFLALLGSFLVSTRLVTAAVARAVTAVTGRLGGPDDPGAFRRQLLAASPLGLGVGFAAVQGLLAVWVVRTSETTATIGFAHPVGVVVAAFVAAVVVARVLELDSAWRFAGLTAYTLNAALWATAMPGFL